jgi:hypothetical protein
MTTSLKKIMSLLDMNEMIGIGTEIVAIERETETMRETEIDTKIGTIHQKIKAEISQLQAKTHLNILLKGMHLTCQATVTFC